MAACQAGNTAPPGKALHHQLLQRQGFVAQQVFGQHQHQLLDIAGVEHRVGARRVVHTPHARREPHLLAVLLKASLPAQLRHHFQKAAITAANQIGRAHHAMLGERQAANAQIVERALFNVPLKSASPKVSERRPPIKCQTEPPQACSLPLGGTWAVDITVVVMIASFSRHPFYLRWTICLAPIL